MTSLLPMRAEAFPAFFEQAVRLFADENVAAGRWAASDAIERARADNARLLPDGIASAGHFLFELTAPAQEGPVGYLWLGEAPRGSTRFAFVYQVFVRPEHRRKGYARAALASAERFAAEQGLCGMGLHVFAHNDGARALYRALGYRVASLNMFKPLADDDA